jgi:tRNA dimethylallyltransferase
MVGLDRDRPSLYQRIDRRVDHMIVGGLVQEVSALLELGYSAQLTAMSGLGYRQIAAYLNGEMNLDQAVERIKFETHRFARQQATWFRRDDVRIRWFNAEMDDCQDAIASAVIDWLAD